MAQPTILPVLQGTERSAIELVTELTERIEAHILETLEKGPGVAADLIRSRFDELRLALRKMKEIQELFDKGDEQSYQEGITRLDALYDQFDYPQEANKLDNEIWSPRDQPLVTPRDSEVGFGHLTEGRPVDQVLEDLIPADRPKDIGSADPSDSIAKPGES